MLDKARRACLISGESGALPEYEVKRQMTPDHTAFQVRASGYGGAEIGRSSEEGLSTRRHEKAPVRCPCGWLAAIRDASGRIVVVEPTYCTFEGHLRVFSQIQFSDFTCVHYLKHYCYLPNNSIAFGALLGKVMKYFFNRYSETFYIYKA